MFTLSKWKKGATAAVLAVTLAGQSTMAVAQQQQPPALVEVAEASAEMMAPQAFMPGTVVSRNDSRIAAEIAGLVKWVAPEGTLLKEGDVIAEIDDRNLRLAFERAKSQVKRLEARVAYLKSDHQRVQELLENKNVPPSRVEEAESTLLMTTEELAQARVAVEQAEIDLDRTKVRAPFPGRVVERLAQAGEYSTPGRQIARLVDTEHLEVSAQAPVNLSALLADGQNVVLKRDAQVLDSAIRAIVPVGNSLSRTMEIRVSVPEGSRYVVGTAVQVGVPASEPQQVVSVPRDALVLRVDGTYIYRVKEDNTAERLLVNTGAATGKRVAILGGIENGDKVIVRGGERLRPGQAVQLREESMQLANGR